MIYGTPWTFLLPFFLLPEELHADRPYVNIQSAVFILKISDVFFNIQTICCMSKYILLHAYRYVNTFFREIDVTL